jgi:hypothetical protein
VPPRGWPDGSPRGRRRRQCRGCAEPAENAERTRRGTPAPGAGTVPSADRADAAVRGEHAHRLVRSESTWAGRPPSWSPRRRTGRRAVVGRARRGRRSGHPGRFRWRSHRMRQADDRMTRRMSELPVRPATTSWNSVESSAMRSASPPATPSRDGLAPRAAGRPRCRGRPGGRRAGRHHRHAQPQVDQRVGRAQRSCRDDRAPARQGPRDAVGARRRAPLRAAGCARRSTLRRSGYPTGSGPGGRPRAARRGSAEMATPRTPRSGADSTGAATTFSCPRLPSGGHPTASCWSHRTRVSRSGGRRGDTTVMSVARRAQAAGWP